MNKNVASLWLFFSAQTIVVVAGWSTVKLVARSLRITHPDEPLPGLTSALLFNYSHWIVALPLPWLTVALYLTCRKRVDTESALLFAATTVVGAGIAICLC